MFNKPVLVMYELTRTARDNKYLLVLDGHVVANGVSVGFMRKRLQQIRNGDVKVLKTLGVWLFINDDVTEYTEIDRDTDIDALMKRFEIHKLIGD